MQVGLNVDRHLITDIVVENTTTSTTLSLASYYLEVVDLSPVLFITSEVNIGDNLLIKVTIGNTVYINGEYIRFTSVDLTTNKLSGLQRGVNGTGMQAYIPEYAEVFSQLSSNLLPLVWYNQIWNSFNYNSTIAGNFVIGTQYVIDTVGTTDFTMIGALSNTVGLRFTATGAGSGNGTATPTNSADPLQTSTTIPAKFLKQDIS